MISNNSTNDPTSSDNSIQFSFQFSLLQYIFIIAYLIILFVGLIGNSLVVTVVLMRKHMRTVTNIFLTNLAIGDFFFILICLPTALMEDTLRTWFLGDLMCKLTKFLLNTSLCVSILTLVFISFERYLAICRPIHSKLKIKRAYIYVTLIWITSILISLPTYFGMHTVKHKNYRVYMTRCLNKWSTQMTITNASLSIFFKLILPSIMMAFCYVQIARRLWFAKLPGEVLYIQKSSDKLFVTSNNLRNISSKVKNKFRVETINYEVSCEDQAFESENPSLKYNSGADEDRKFSKVEKKRVCHGKYQLRKRRRVAKMLFTVVLLFISCHLPTHLFDFALVSKPDKSVAMLLNKLAIVAHFFIFFNSAMNPVIYNFMCTKFRKEFKRVCNCARKNPMEGKIVAPLNPN